jgi:hypothetical protein
MSHYARKELTPKYNVGRFLIMIPMAGRLESVNALGLDRANRTGEKDGSSRDIRCL